MRSVICLLTTLLLLSSLCMWPSASPGLSFTAEPLYSGDGDWYGLRLEPGEDRSLILQLTNHSARSMTAHIVVANATTADDGFIEYAGSTEPANSNHPALSDIARPDQEFISIEAGEQQLLSIAVSIPPEGLEGTVLGGICVQLQSASPFAPSEEGVQYVLPVSLSTTGSEAGPEFQVDSLLSGLSNYRPCVIASIRNTRPVTARAITVHAELYQAGAVEPFYILDKTVDMAPLSSWRCLFPDQEENGYPPGDYLLRMTLDHDGTIHQLEQHFTLTADDMEFIQANAVTTDSGALSGSDHQMRVRTMLCASVLVVLILLLMLILKRCPGAKQNLSGGT